MTIRMIFDRDEIYALYNWLVNFQLAYLFAVLNENHS